MNHTASSRGPERDAIYIEYNVKPLGVGGWRSCSRMLTNRKQPKCCQFKIRGAEWEKTNTQGQFSEAEEWESIRWLFLTGNCDILTQLSLSPGLSSLATEVSGPSSGHIPWTRAKSSNSLCISLADSPEHCELHSKPTLKFYGGTWLV